MRGVDAERDGVLERGGRRGDAGVLGGLPFRLQRLLGSAGRDGGRERGWFHACGGGRWVQREWRRREWGRGGGVCDGAGARAGSDEWAARW